MCDASGDGAKERSLKKFPGHTGDVKSVKKFRLHVPGNLRAMTKNRGRRERAEAQEVSWPRGDVKSVKKFRLHVPGNLGGMTKNHNTDLSFELQT